MKRLLFALLSPLAQLLVPPQPQFLEPYARVVQDLERQRRFAASCTAHMTATRTP